MKRHDNTARKSAPAPKPKRFLSPKDLAAKGVPFHINYLRKLWMTEKFPRPIKLSPHRIAWDEAVVDEWLTSKLTEVA